MKNDAVEAYIDEIAVKEKHEEFIVNVSGLITISKLWPLLVASSDRIVFCECCLRGYLKVKCLHISCTQILIIEESVNIKNSCLVLK